MCGIVGYIGDRDATSILVEGLKKLEYRGYDSAGIALYDQNKINVVKKVGKLAELEELVAQQKPQGSLGIGHTRWATHGKPSTPNSHPHSSSNGDFVVVHNGIIENYSFLKKELKDKGYEFYSETDTEVIPNLLQEYYEGDLAAAVRKTIDRLEGSYALGVISKEEPDEIIAVRQDSPLIIGLSDGEYFIGSDIPAILRHTNQVYILDDGEMAVVKRDGVQLSTTDGEELEKEVFTVDWDPGMAEKAGYDHFMLKEIYEQPDTVRRCTAGRLNEADVHFDDVNLSADDLEKYNKVYIVACGTAYNSGLVGKFAIEKLARIPVEVAIASEFRYRNPIVDENTLVIVVSQSGETADTLAAVREAKSKGARVVGVCNVVGSTIPRETDDVIYIHAGPEIAVASTKAYIGMITVFYMLAIYFARNKGVLAAEDSKRLISDLKAIPEQIEEIINSNQDQIKELAVEYAKHPSAF
ncbi:MAG: glutamine--fructose-6-phosphate transaminase (isomerizing), partial [Bacillota bacterium]